VELKKIIMVICSLYLFFLVSCTPKAQIPEQVYVGSEAAEMRFLENTPLPKTFASSGQLLDVAMEVKNQGTFPLRGRLFLSGFDPNVIQLPHSVDIPSRNCGFNEIFPKSRSYIEGGTCVEEFRAPLNLESIIDSYDATIFGQLVYPYVTEANVVLCVDPNIQQFTIGRKACQMTSVTYSGGQGAPVAVTTVEPSPIGDGKILFRITIQNIGDGEVVDYNKAPTQLKPSDVGNVFYKIGTPASNAGGARIAIGTGGNSIAIGRAWDVYYGDNGFGFNFRPNNNFAYNEGRVRLYNGKAVITTIIDYGSINTAFKTPLQLSLAYGYLEETFRDIRIIDVENFAGFERRGGGISIVYDDQGRKIEVDTNGRIVYRDDDFSIDIDSLFGGD
jgi:hypothetical protein